MHVIFYNIAHARRRDREDQYDLEKMIKGVEKIMMEKYRHCRMLENEQYDDDDWWSISIFLWKSSHVYLSHLDNQTDMMSFTPFPNVFPIRPCSFYMIVSAIMISPQWIQNTACEMQATSSTPSAENTTNKPRRAISCIIKPSSRRNR